MSKVVLIFLIFILVLGIFGKWRFPKIAKPKFRKKVHKTQKCPKCGRYNLTGKDCECE